MSALVSSLSSSSKPARFVTADLAVDHSRWIVPRPGQTEGRDARTLGSLIKRTVDITGALAGLVLLWPLLLILTVLIRLDSAGPALFRQVRRGHRGRPFWLLKFRTMAVDAERRLDELESSNESRGGVLFKMRDDPRVTRLGGFLRRTSLDELPQLINVLKGEMSLVGPRPLSLRDSERLRDVDASGSACRLQVLPGLTGPWQVAGRSELDYRQMVDLDCDYAATWSIPGDVRIIARTFTAVLHGHGAY